VGWRRLRRARRCQRHIRPADGEAVRACPAPAHTRTPPLLPHPRAAPARSYDYNAPVAEGGTHGYSSDGDKYLAVRTVLAYWADAPLPDEPPTPVATAYGILDMAQVAPLAANLAVLVPGGPATLAGGPSTMEALNISRGWALYVANAAFTAASPAAPAVKLAAVSDYALVGGMDVASGAVTPLGFVDRPTAASTSLSSAAGMWQVRRRREMGAAGMLAAATLLHAPQPCDVDDASPQCSHPPTLVLFLPIIFPLFSPRRRARARTRWCCWRTRATSSA
jgi:hypothetical protein